MRKRSRKTRESGRRGVERRGSQPEPALGLWQAAFLATEELGEGSLQYVQSNPSVVRAPPPGMEASFSRDGLAISQRLLREIYSACIVVMYELVALLYAADHGMLDSQGKRRRTLTELEDLIGRFKVERDRLGAGEGFSRSATHLWERVVACSGSGREGDRGRRFPCGGVVPSRGADRAIRSFKVPDYFMARAFYLLRYAGTVAGSGAERLPPRIDYRRLRIRDLGDIYGRLLEYVPSLACEDLVAVKRGSGNKTYREYIPVARLKSRQTKQRAAVLAAGVAAAGNPGWRRGGGVLGIKEKGGFHLRRASSRRKKSGAFYTPDRIVRYIVDRALGPLVRGEHRCPGDPQGGTPLSSDEILEIKVLDPAMGSGHFLIAASEYLARAHAQALVRESDAGHLTEEDSIARSRRLVAEHCVYGVDVNPTAVQIARLLMCLFTMVPATPRCRIDHHLKCGDSLLGVPFGEEGLAGSGPFRWESEFPEVAYRQDGTRRPNPGFDAVVGNPPYLSFSGRHKAKAAYSPTELAQTLGIRGGWRALHGFFMVRSLDLARQGGLVSMIVPDQVGHLPGYGPVRIRMTESGELVEARYWGEDVFDGVTTPALSFVVSKSQGTLRRALVIDRDGRRSRIRADGDGVWHSSPSADAHARLAARHQTRLDFSDPGVHTGNVGRQLILSKPARGAVPILEGRQIHRFHCDRPERWLDLGFKPRPGQYFRVGPRQVYENTHILLRQTANKPIAARHIYPCHFRNSVLALRAPEGFSVEYLLGLLNSEAVAWLYRASSFESQQRAFPQVKIRLLRRLPIPDPGQRRNRAIISCVEALVRELEAQKAGAEIGHRTASGDAALTGEIDDLVWDLYGLEASVAGRSSAPGGS